MLGHGGLADSPPRGHETICSGRPGPDPEEPWCQSPGSPLCTRLEGMRGRTCGGRVLRACRCRRKGLTPPGLCDPEQVPLPLWASPLKCLCNSGPVAVGGEEGSQRGRRQAEGLAALPSPGLGPTGGSHGPPPPLQVFSIVVFGSIVNEGYLNSPSESEEFCVYNRNPNACGYGVTVGVLAFLTCLLYLALDVYFPQISSVKDRKKAVLSDIGVSAFWAFLWFVGFCYLANQWQVSKPKDNPLNEGTDAARAAIAFSFFSIFTWAGQAVLAFQRYQIGADSALFSQDYMDPSQDSSMPYAPYVEPSTGPDPAGMGGTYQQPANTFDTEPQGYQSQGY
uniref:Synaptogyrin 1 n=1 Tax=Sus scrofa TaxID=9823 RepID=A0A8D1XPL0_PIG